MPSFINTNIPSLNAQRNLNASASSLNTSLQRLSSGLRINSAKDDAAGLGIAERMTSQIRGMNQAIRNSNDGISLAQTAEGALATTGDMLQRIRELAVQASNATNSPSDRQAIQAEVGQLTSEINRIAQTTSFNGQMLLDGTMGTAHFQVGPNAGETIGANGTNFLTTTYGNNRVEANPAVPASGAAVFVPAAPVYPTNVVAGQTLNVSGYLGSGDYVTVAGDTARTIAEGVNRLTGTTGVTASAVTNTNLDMAPGSYSFMIKSDNPNPIVVSFSVSGTGATATDFASGINAINAQTAKTGVMAEFDTVNGGIKLSNIVGNDISLVNNSATEFDVGVYSLAGAVTDATKLTAAGVAATDNLTVNGRVVFDSQNSFSITDPGSGLALGGAGVTTPVGSTLHPVSSLDVTTFENAQLALSIVDAALITVTGQRAQYGALQSRFEATINNLQIAAENTTASRSRIQDADFAAETANLSRATILQQAGTAMLAQANQLPQNVLTLLR